MVWRSSTTTRTKATTTIRSARSIHANLVYHANRLFNFGGELMWGQRENSNGAKGEAVRFQFSIQYKFR